MFRKLIGACVGLAMMGMAGAANAVPITYELNRVIGAGTVTGFIETDGTLGVLSTINITDWVLTLTAPDLLGGSPDVIDFATQIVTNIGGMATTATSTGLFFDFDLSGSNFFLLQGTSPLNYWCLETGSPACTGFGLSEAMGQGSVGFGPVAQSTTGQTGVEQFGTAIPEPSTLTLFATGLALLAFLGWWRRSRQRTHAALRSA